MSNINFSIKKIFPGNDKQKSVGIYATFNMTLEGPDGIIAAFNDMKLMKNKSGEYYIAPPFRTYDGKDKDGNDKKVKVNYVSLFPEEKNWDKKDRITKLVLDELNNGSSETKQQSNTSSAPKTQSTSSKEPW